VDGGYVAPQPPQQKPKIEGVQRARHAYSILLWQETLPKPSIDIAAYKKELTEAIGESEMERFASLPTPEQESMRFSAELLFAGVDSIAKEAEALQHALLSDKLKKEVAAMSDALQKAEREGNEAEIKRLMDESKLLTGKIARLHDSR
ncbi:hypothetical protein K8R03_01805, partial [Candidatus Kaiserbacteria bacterium]|nr:hypothetical protein [Candidatus Kaiserbacteria bacterium]